MWIDMSSEPVAIRLAGVLNEATGANLLGVVTDCVAQGRLDLDLDISALRVDGSGWPVIDRMRQLLVDSGGHMHCGPA